MQRSKARSEIRAAAINRQCVLDEIVGADAQERHVIHESVHRQRGGWCFDHHAERKIVPIRHASRVELPRCFVQQVLRLLHLVERDD